ncbi:MAG: class I SAM-dependent methyltransferase [Ignavibacteria bacterium]
MTEKMRSYLLYNADQTKNNSVSGRMRRKRMEFFRKFTDGLKKPLRILDVGGSDYHWRDSDFVNNRNYYITIVNTELQDMKDLRNICFIKRDVSDLGFFDNKEYDIVYSNSLLEHLNTFEQQMFVSDEMRRIGKHYFVQTPNYYFPVEPHFLFPFFQFLSESLKTKLIMRYDLGWFQKEIDETRARELARSIRLLKKDELLKLFPDAKFYSEKYFLLNKSFIAYK